jgi:two-component system, sensor histidine kinase RegB
MEPTPAAVLDRDMQGHWVRLQTLTRARWLAITGQLVALFTAYFGFELQFDLLLSVLVVAVLVASNLFSTWVFPRTRRLSELEALLTLVFDALQLTLLLFLTGGLTNPFALLLLAPATIAATVLRLPGTLAVAGLTMLLATLLVFSYQPLFLPDGTRLALPELFRFGFWLGIMVGVGFIGLYSRSLVTEKQALTEALLATQMALAREQKLTDLGGVVAAAAHELGTPLATIKLVSAELADALHEDDELREDALLIRDQAERCRDILHAMGRTGKRDPQLDQAPLEAVLTEAAGLHAQRGKLVDYRLSDGPLPEIPRQPEIIHGLRNVIQNAVDFAATRVVVMAWVQGERLHLRIADDGPGFPPNLLGRIGEPYLRDRRASADRRPGYDGMGLGLFIAKTLLERSGARVQFSNASAGPDHPGACIDVDWPLQAIARTPRPVLGATIANRSDG